MLFLLCSLGLAQEKIDTTSVHPLNGFRGVPFGPTELAGQPPTSSPTCAREDVNEWDHWWVCEEELAGQQYEMYWHYRAIGRQYVFVSVLVMGKGFIEAERLYAVALQTYGQPAKPGILVGALPTNVLWLNGQASAAVFDYNSINDKAVLSITSSEWTKKAQVFFDLQTLGKGL